MRVDTDYLSEYITIEACRYKLKIPLFVEYVGDKVFISQDRRMRPLGIWFRKVKFKNKAEKFFYSLLNRIWIFKNADCERAAEVLRAMGVI